MTTEKVEWILFGLAFLLKTTSLFVHSKTYCDEQKDCDIVNNYFANVLTDLDSSSASAIRWMYYIGEIFAFIVLGYTWYNNRKEIGTSKLHILNTLTIVVGVLSAILRLISLVIKDNIIIKKIHKVFDDLYLLGSLIVTFILLLQKCNGTRVNTKEPVKQNTQTKQNNSGNNQGVPSQVTNKNGPKNS